MILKIKIILLFVTGLLFLGSCSLTGTNSIDDTPDYSSKNVCIYMYVDDEQTDLEPVSEYVYSSSGEFETKYVSEYEQQSDGVYLNTITYTYTYSDGSPILSEKAEFQYFKDYYNGSNYDYICYSETDYTYSDGTYTLSGSDEAEYDSQAAGVDGNADDYAYYSKYTVFDSTGTAVETQTCTWITLPDGYIGYQLERYYDGEESAENLVEEYVCHYDDDTDYTNYIYEMCHFINPGEDDTDDHTYYYTRYSRNNNNIVYQQADFDYSVESGTDVDAATGIFIDMNGTDSDAMTQNIDANKISNQQYVLNFEFDSSGNRTKRVDSLMGELIAYTNYSYDIDDNLLKTTEYEEGGDYLYSNETVEYNEKYDDNGDYCYIVTTYTYDYSSGYYDDEDSSESDRSTLRSTATAHLIIDKSNILKQKHRK